MGDQAVVKISGASLEPSVIEEPLINDLRASLRGKLLSSSDADYEQARQVWNGMIDRRPALIARCRGVADIIDVVNFARRNELLVAVRGGAHNVAGNATCDGGLVIDLSEMRSIRVDPAGRSAHVEAGATWGEFDRETQAFGLATPGGQISTTGVAGLTLGGGWGHLARRYGLASDNLISADVVTADGSFVTTSKTQNPDLFWGLRGGGGNFGVVSSLEYQLHPVGPVMGGLVAYPMEKAKEALRLFRDLTSSAPDELASDIVLITMPDGTPVVGMVLCYSGPTEEGERLLKPLKTFSPIVMDAIGPMAYTAAQKLVDDFYPKGLQNYWKSSFLTEISDEAIDTIVRFCADRPSPMCHGLIEHQLGGAVSRIGHDETAFNHRNLEYSFMSIGQCAEAAEAEACVRWAREFWEAMQPYATSSVYVNYLGREADEGSERIKAAYGPEKYQKLVALKQKYDPANMFRLNQNVRPNP